MGGTAIAMGHGVVDIALGGGPVAARGPAGEIAGPHEIRQWPRRQVSGFCGHRGGNRLQLGRFRQLADNLGRDDAVAVEKSRSRAGAVHRGTVGDHVNHHGVGLPGRRTGRAARLVASARQPVEAGRECAQRVGAQLLDRAWIVVAHRLGEFVEPAIERLARRRENGSVDQCHARVHRGDLEIAVLRVFARSAHRIGVHPDDHAIDLRCELPAGHRRPARCFDRQLRIDRGQRLGVDDQVGAKHDRAEQPKVDVSGTESGGDGRQPLLHGAGVPQVAVAHRHAGV